MNVPTDVLALGGSPAQWATLVLVLVAIAAPRVLPALFRFLAFRAANLLGSRAGLPHIPDHRSSERRRAAREAEPEVEVLPPLEPRATPRAGHSDTLSRPPSPRRAAPAWRVVVVVALAAAVLSWFLLRSR